MEPLSDHLSQSSLTEQHVDQRNQEIEGELKTGTTTVGVKAEGGVILGADTRASAGNMVSSKNVMKIHQVHPSAAITIAGGVSAAQSLVRTIKAETNLYDVRRGEIMSMTALSTQIHNLLRSGAFFVSVPLLGGVDSKGSHVISYDPLGGHIEEKYTATGSGTQFALGVLEQEYEDGLDISRARDITERAIKSAAARDTASGNGMTIATITDEGVEIEESEEINVN